MLQKILLYLLPFYAWYVYGKVCPHLPTVTEYEKSLDKNIAFAQHQLAHFLDDLEGDRLVCPRALIHVLPFKRDVDKVFAPLLETAEKLIATNQQNPLPKDSLVLQLKVLRALEIQTFQTVFDSLKGFVLKSPNMDEKDYERYNSYWLKPNKINTFLDVLLYQDSINTEHIKYIPNTSYWTKKAYFDILEHRLILNYFFENVFFSRFGMCSDRVSVRTLSENSISGGNHYVELGEVFTQKIIIVGYDLYGYNYASFEIDGQKQPINYAGDFVYKTKKYKVGKNKVQVKAGIFNRYTGDTIYKESKFEFEVLAKAPLKSAVLPTYTPIKTQALAYLQNGGMGGKISPENLLKNTHIQLKTNDLEDSTCACKVLNFELTYTPLRENSIVYKNSGGEFSAAIRQQFSKAQKGDIFNIERIKLACVEPKKAANVNYLSFIID